MRVLLIQAVSSTSRGECVYPLGLARLTAVLKDAHELRGLDLNLDPFPWPRTVSLLGEFNLQVACISLRNLDPLAGNLVSFVPQLKTLVALLEQRAPEAKLIIGGSGFSLFAERLLSELPQLHCGLTGEAEESLPMLLQNPAEPQAVPGAVFRQGGRIIRNGQCYIGDLETLPAPDYSLFPPAAYQERNQYVTFMGVEAKRGCPHRCAYCLYPCLQGNTVRLFSPAAVADELERLHRAHGVNAVHFTDPVVNQPPGHLRSICEQVISRGLKLQWTGFFREDSLSARDLPLHRRAGLSAIYFSADGASEQALRLLNKGLTLDHIEKAAETAAASGVITVYHFLVNLPGESHESADQSRRLVARILELHARANNPAAMVFNNLRLYPGAPLTTLAIEAGLVDPRTDLLYPVYFNPPPFDGLRHELNAMSISPEHMGLSATGVWG